MVIDKIKYVCKFQNIRFIVLINTIYEKKCASQMGKNQEWLNPRSQITTFH